MYDGCTAALSKSDAMTPGPRSCEKQAHSNIRDRSSCCCDSRMVPEPSPAHWWSDRPKRALD